MLYVVEIEDNEGRKATKEYEVRSFRELEHFHGFWNHRDFRNGVDM